MCIYAWCTTYQISVLIAILVVVQMENGIAEARMVEREPQMSPELIVLHKLWKLKRCGSGCGTLHPAHS